METTADRIRQLRLERGFSGGELAEKLGIARSTLSQYETGKSNPDDTMKKKLCSIFGVSMDYLTCFSDVRSPQYGTPFPEETVNAFMEELLKDYPDLKARVKNTALYSRTGRFDLSGIDEISKQMIVLAIRNAINRRP